MNRKNSQRNWLHSPFNSLFTKTRKKEVALFLILMWFELSSKKEKDSQSTCPEQRQSQIQFSRKIKDCSLSHHTVPSHRNLHLTRKAWNWKNQTLSTICQTLSRINSRLLGFMTKCGSIRMRFYFTSRTKIEEEICFWVSSHTERVFQLTSDQTFCFFQQLLLWHLQFIVSPKYEQQWGMKIVMVQSLSLMKKNKYYFSFFYSYFICVM